MPAPPAPPAARAALALAALAAACSAQRAQAPPSVTVAVVRVGTQCGADAGGPSARWITTDGALRAAMGAGGVFGAEPSPPVDFKKEGVLAVTMGQRPTGGYSLALQDPSVAVEKGVATMVVRFQEPEAGGFVTQVLTSPCLLVRIPRQGIREVRVVDPSGAVRATARTGPEPEERKEPRRPPP